MSRYQARFAFTQTAYRPGFRKINMAEASPFQIESTEQLFAQMDGFRAGEAGCYSIRTSFREKRSPEGSRTKPCTLRRMTTTLS